MKVYIGSDHRGFTLKEKLKYWMSDENISFEDVGAHTLDPNDDYPIFTQKVAEKISSELEQSRGVVICGSGVGVDIVANKFNGVRAGLAINREQVKSAREDDDINVLAIAADETGEEDVKKMVKAFIETEFEPSEKHTRRLREIDEIEQEQ